MTTFETPGVWMVLVALAVFAVGSGIALLGMRLGGLGAKRGRYADALHTAADTPPFAYLCPLTAPALLAALASGSLGDLDTRTAQDGAHLCLAITGRRGAAFGAALHFEVAAFQKKGGTLLLLLPLDEAAEETLRDDGLRLWLDAGMAALCGGAPVTG